VLERFTTTSKGDTPHLTSQCYSNQGKHRSASLPLIVRLDELTLWIVVSRKEYLLCAYCYSFDPSTQMTICHTRSDSDIAYQAVDAFVVSLHLPHSLLLLWSEIIDILDLLKRHSSGTSRPRCWRRKVEGVGSVEKAAEMMIW
jgi:hypothetical protein